MKQIKISLDDSIHQILCVQGAINSRSPETEARAILYHVCKQNAEIVASLASKIKNNAPNISDIQQSDDGASSSPNVDSSQQALYDQREINHLQEIVHGDGGVAVYTYNPEWGDAFLLDKEKRTGYTGDWRLNPVGLQGGIIVIYFSQMNNGSIDNIIYRARITEVISCLTSSRYKIHFKDWEIVGKTHSMWKEFAKTGSNPIKYF